MLVVLAAAMARAAAPDFWSCEARCPSLMGSDCAHFRCPPLEELYALDPGDGGESVRDTTTPPPPLLEGARIVTRDLASPGDQLLTLDVKHGLVCLDVPVSRNLSANQILAMLQDPQSPFWASWRYARSEELCGFLRAYAIAPEPCPGSVTVSGEREWRFSQQLGATLSLWTATQLVSQTWGLLSPSPSGRAGQGLVEQQVDSELDAEVLAVVVEEDALPLDLADPRRGSFLVREVDDDPEWPGWSRLPALPPSTTTDGFGALPRAGSTTFRVWSPGSSRVAVLDMDASAGDPAVDSPGWSATLGCEDSTTPKPGAPCESGVFSGDVTGAEPGDRYRYLTHVIAGQVPYTRRDPYGRLVTTPALSGDSVIYDPEAFSWDDQGFRRPRFAEMVQLQLQVRDFAAEAGGPRGSFDSATERLDDIAALGFNVVLLHPVHEAQTREDEDVSPEINLFDNEYVVDDPFAVENASYGGPDGLKRFVNEAHRLGLAVHLNLVLSNFGVWNRDFQHSGPMRLFSGWGSLEYPWGPHYWNYERVSKGALLRPNFDRPEVRSMLLDIVTMWIDEYHIDGFRFDSVQRMFELQHDEGYQLLQDVNALLPEDVFSAAEDFTHGRMVLDPPDQGGLGFDARWGCWFDALKSLLPSADEHGAPHLTHFAKFLETPPTGMPTTVNYGPDVYVHQLGSLVEGIDPSDPTSWRARKLASLSWVLLLVAPGVPLVDQGEPLLHSPLPLDWSLVKEHPGIWRLFRDLAHLRRNRALGGLPGHTRGLVGEGARVSHLDETQDLLALHRFTRARSGEDVMVLVNASGAAQQATFGFPGSGAWKVRLNSDARDYGADFDQHGPTERVLVMPDSAAADGFPTSAPVELGAYSAVVLSRDCEDADADGVCEAADNCLEVFNPSQCDTDLDGFGNLCDADISGDGTVGWADVQWLRLDFGRRVPPASPHADLDCDGRVGVPDFVRLSIAYGGPPGPSGLDCAGEASCRAR